MKFHQFFSRCGLAVIVTGLVWVSAGQLAAQDVATQDAAAEPAAADAPEGNAGLPLLEEAIQKKLEVRRVADLDRVAELCQEALAQGLDEGQSKFARSLYSATLLEKTMRVVEPLLEGKLDITWNQRRTLALAELDKAAKVNPEDAEVQLLIAQLHELPGGDPELGGAAAKNAAKYFADRPDRRSEALALQAAFVDDLDEKLKLYDEAIQIDQTNWSAWRDRGRVKFDLGKAEEAIQDFEQVLEKNAGDSETLQVLAGVLASQER
ncbi:MAG: hypothetical protein KDA60_04285, partial [Planctomycetales bacterium]|nr:hypothetical protein [Planctomycetales bacterium]